MLDNPWVSPPLTEEERDLASAVFSPTYYVATYGRLSGKSASHVLRHFLTIGIHEAVSPSPLFDPLVYEQHLLLAGHRLLETEQPSFLHWLRNGRRWRVVPTAMFDESYYQAHNADVAQSDLFGFAHYLAWGMPEGRLPNATFDVAFDLHVIEAFGPDSWNVIDAHVRRHGLEPDAGHLPLSVMEEKSFDGVDERAPPVGGYSLAWRWHAGAALDDANGRAGRDPYGRYFDAIPMESEQALAWVKRTTSSWPQPEDPAALDNAVIRLGATALFDVDYYRAQAGLDERDLDPATHYILVGEALGLKPSPDFDPFYYAERYPDVLRAGMVLLLHYAEYGRAEGRHGAMPSVSHINPARFDPDRENVIVVVHESSRTGAPILGWNIVWHLAERYNVFTVLLGGGALTPEFESLSAETYGPFLKTQRDVVDITYGLRPLFAQRRFRYAIVNSSESRRFVEVCGRQLVPTVFLLHEFGTYVQPLSELRSAFDWATEIVFPAPTVARSSETVHPALKDRPIRILPQGMSVVPAGEALPKPPPQAQFDALSRARQAGTFLVLGAGTVQLRKGVDLFLAAAAAARRASPNRPIHFLWVGHGYNPTKDMGYSVYLHEQIQRSGLEAHVTFLSEVSDLEPVYALADAFLLSSRLDPLPNVSIDAAIRGIPLICFRDASGAADLMLADPLTAAGVVPHLDTEAAGAMIAHLAGDEAARAAMSQATARLAREIFDMERYVAQLDALGRAHGQTASLWRADAETILADDAFDQDLFLGLEPVLETRDLTVARYLALARIPAAPPEEAIEEDDAAAEKDTAVGAEPVVTRAARRPAPGFDPRLWVAAHPDRMPQGENAFADFIRAGRPAGPWQHPVVRPPTQADSLSLGALRAVLHAHLADLRQGADLLVHLAHDTLACDLLVTTESEATAVQLRRLLGAYANGTVNVQEGSGTLSSLVTALAPQVAAYDVIGHISARKGDADRIWREFQWQALLGGRHAMADRILDAFARTPALGLVFPAEPHLRDWDEATRERLAGLARALGHADPLPAAWDFPAGGMLWMRSAVLRALSRLGPLEQSEDEDEDEVVSQIVPIVSEHAGLSHVVAHMPGVFW